MKVRKAVDVSCWGTEGLTEEIGDRCTVLKLVDGQISPPASLLTYPTAIVAVRPIKAFDLAFIFWNS